MLENIKLLPSLRIKKLRFDFHTLLLKENMRKEKPDLLLILMISGLIRINKL